jgi:hypothetical protein
MEQGDIFKIGQLLYLVAPVPSALLETLIVAAAATEDDEDNGDLEPSVGRDDCELAPGDINPGRAPTPGRDIVVYKRNEEVLIKQFVERTSTELVLKQLKPEETLRLPLPEVAEFHFIVGSDEEGGL